MNGKRPERQWPNPTDVSPERKRMSMPKGISRSRGREPHSTGARTDLPVERGEPVVRDSLRGSGGPEHRAFLAKGKMLGQDSVPRRFCCAIPGFRD